MIDTIIFDLEGVVVDTEPIWDRAQEELLRRRGLVYDREKGKHLITGRSQIEGMIIMQEIYGLSGDPKELTEKRAGLVRELFESQLNFIPGFQSFYKGIRGRYRTCIATALAKELLEVIDKRLMLSELFDGKIFSIADVGYVSKPNPHAFLYAAKKMDSQPQDCLVIEDAPNGIEAAKRANMRCVALTTSFKRDKLSGADFIVGSYPEIDLSAF